jgi:hypothetical protein
LIFSPDSPVCATPSGVPCFCPGYCHILTKGAQEAALGATFAAQAFGFLAGPLLVSLLRAAMVTSTTAQAPG